MMTSMSGKSQSAHLASAPKDGPIGPMAIADPIVADVVSTI